MTSTYGDFRPLLGIARIYIGAERLTLAGAAQAATLPAGTTHIVLASEGGDVRYAVNVVATNASPGYVAAGHIVPIRTGNIASFSLYGAVGAYANLMYYAE